MLNSNGDPRDDALTPEPTVQKGRATVAREQIEERYEGRKTAAVILWIVAVLWVLVFLWLNWRGWNTADKPLLTALRDFLLAGVLPGVALFFTGKWILSRSLTAQEEEEAFHRETDFMQYFMRKGRAAFGDIRDEFGLKDDEIRGFLIDLSGKRLFRGYIDWQNEEVVSIGEVEIGEECPGCGSPLNYLDPSVGVCDNCGLQAFR